MSPLSEQIGQSKFKLALTESFVQRHTIRTLLMACMHDHNFFFFFLGGLSVVIPCLEDLEQSWGMRSLMDSIITVCYNYSILLVPSPSQLS